MSIDLKKIVEKWDLLVSDLEYGVSVDDGLDLARQVAEAVLHEVGHKMHHEWGDELDWEDYQELKAEILGDVP